MIYDNICKVLPTREVHWALVSSIFERSVMCECSTHMTDFSYSESRPQTKNRPSSSITLLAQIIRLNCISWPKASGRENILIRQNIPRAQSSSLRRHPKVNPENRPFLGMQRIWATPAWWVNLLLESNPQPFGLCSLTVKWSNFLEHLYLAIRLFLIRDSNNISMNMCIVGGASVGRNWHKTTNNLSCKAISYMF